MDLDQAQIEKIVQTIVAEVLSVLRSKSPDSTECNCQGDSSCSAVENHGGKCVRFRGRLLSEENLLQTYSPDCPAIDLSADCIVTPLARDRAAELHVQLRFDTEKTHPEQTSPDSKKKCLVVIAGRCSRSEEKALLEAARCCGWEVRIEGVMGERFKDLSSAAFRAADLLEEGDCERAIVLDESVFQLLQLLSSRERVNAAICWDENSAIQSRRQSQSNFLLIGNQLLGFHMLGRMVRAWLQEE
jgi:ribose 5-phosphate isomerase RpiB